MTAREWTCDEAYLIDGWWGRGSFAKPWCAAIGFRGDVCTFAAPILRKAFLGKDKNVCRDLIKRRGWKVLG